jgi:hypothetical protein
LHSGRASDIGRKKGGRRLYPPPPPRKCTEVIFYLS